LSELIDTGFDAVLAGEAWAPDVETLREQVRTVVDAAADAITATVIPDPPLPAPADLPISQGLTPAGVQAAKALVHLPMLDWPALAKLAREMAMDIKERTTILKEFALTEAQYDFLEAHNEFYRQALAAACKEWHAPLTTQERIKVEAAAILEDSLLVLGSRMQNKGEGLPGVVEAAKFFAKIASVGERENGPVSPGERFTINIDLGGDKSLSVSATPAPKASEAGAGLRALSADGEEV
jgi:hypothetical protein